MQKNTIIEGRCWVIKDSAGSIINNIDTDMIFHNAHLAITDIEKMGALAFGNLDEWKDFPKKAKKSDILICGQNFGAGSSRQQAVDCFKALGIGAIIAESFGAIYFRNAVNSGFPVIKSVGISDCQVQTGDTVQLNLLTGEIFNVTQDTKIATGKSFSEVQLDIYNAGSIFACNE